MSDAPTPDTVRAFWSHLHTQYGSRIVRKRDASEMKLVATFLDTMGVLERDAFLDRFTTVIGRRIYAPFAPGDAPTASARWSHIVVATHEHQHIVQFMRAGAVPFSTRYTLSRRARADYEAEAYSCDLQLHYWRTGVMRDPARVASVLEHYGLSERHVERAEQQLRDAADRIARGEVVTEAAAAALAWLEHHAPELRHVGR